METPRSYVFPELGSESRDKFMASGQQIAVKGTILGYYLFKRCDTNKREMQMPWDTAAPEALKPRTRHQWVERRLLEPSPLCRV